MPPQLATIDMVFAVVTETQKDVEELKEEFKILNGTVRENTTDVAVLKDWRQSQVNPAVNKVGDMRVEIAKVAGLGGSVGAVLGIILLVGKAIGVF